MTKILYVGQIKEGRTAFQRMLALKDLGNDVVPINNFSPVQTIYGWFLDRLCFKTGFPQDKCGINRQIIEQITRNKYDILWLDKILNLRTQTLIKIKKEQPHCYCVFYSPDDMKNVINRSRYFIKILPLIDMFITTKSYQVGELKSEGCKNVIFIDNAFDPHTHKPYVLSESEKKQWGAEVGFIGGFEINRYEQMFYIADNGIKVQIAGSFWGKMPKIHPNFKIFYNDIIDKDYAKAICATKINLCFLRKANRDLQTTRSIEIPACGGFMLAERSNEHLALFEEGKEAEFFGNEQELLDKVKYYLSHPDERKKITAAGRERCLKSGYSNHDRLKAIMDKIVGLKNS